MNRVVLQVPIPKTLRDAAQAAVPDYGFSSLQDMIRLFLHKVAGRTLDIKMGEVENIKLTPAAKRRFKKMEEDFKTGRNIFHAKDVDDLMKQLNA